MNAFRRRDLFVVASALFLCGAVVVSWSGRPRRAAQRAACAERLRQLHGGFQSYAQNNAVLPSAGRSDATEATDWIYWQPARVLKNSAVASNVINFTEARLQCPGDTRFRRREYKYSYAMNVHLERQTPSRLSNTNDLILLFEETAPNDGACAAGEPRDKLTRRHGGRSNAGFLDGRVEAVSEHGATQREHVRPIIAQVDVTSNTGSLLPAR